MTKPYGPVTPALAAAGYAQTGLRPEQMIYLAPTMAGGGCACLVGMLACVLTGRAPAAVEAEYLAAVAVEGLGGAEALAQVMGWDEDYVQGLDHGFTSCWEMAEGDVQRAASRYRHAATAQERFRQGCAAGREVGRALIERPAWLADAAS